VKHRSLSPARRRWARAYLDRRTRDRAIVREAEAILREAAGDGAELPLVVTKQGGYTACYYWDAHAIAVRENSWRLMGLAQKRLTIVHEWIHACGLEHSAACGFEGPRDLLSLVLYRRIWGEDGPLRELFARLEEAAGAIYETRTVRVPIASSASS
jgi:hypothetical protein